ncbi:MAG: metallophosphoesterase family protein [Bacteroidia bacterium]
MEYAISDIHGNVETFRTLVQKQLNLRPSDTLYLLGDFIDRGPDSAGVVDYIIQLQEKGYQVHNLLGNHEWMLLRAIHGDIEMERSWLYNGGEEALNSWDVAFAKNIPDKYINFFKECSMYIEHPNFYLVHAGFDFKTPFQENRYQMLWIRHWYNQIDYDQLGHRVVIHGHTPKMKELIEHDLAAMPYPTINIDAGCFSKKEGYGYLCAYNMTENKLIFQKNVDTRELF